jgi:ribosomal protein S27E
MKRTWTNPKTLGPVFAAGLICLPLGLARAATQATYYVSPSGSDANPGTQASPFKTIAKAQSVVRTVNTSMTGDIVVTLRGGTYALDSTLAFGPADGGTNGNYVRYVAYTGETPLITGGQPITGWTVSDATKNIWKATGVTARFRQLYVNGTKAIRARTPNLGTGNAPNFYRLTKVDTSTRDLAVASSYVANWNNLAKVEMHLMIAWSDATMRIASITTSGSTSKIKFQDPEGTMLFNRPYPMLGVAFDSNPPKQQCFYFENAYEFLDQAGEWYLDETANTLYYMPRTGENLATATVVAPVLQNLITITGPSTSQTVGYLAFQGLDFAHTTFLRPSQTGLLDLQAGQFNVAAPGGNNYMLWRPEAGVKVTNAHNILFERNLFAQMGASGLDFISGTHDDKIIGNVFTDLGGTAVTVGKFAKDTLTEIHIAYNPTDTKEVCTNDTVMDNLVTKVTTEIQGAVGIGAGYPKYIDIEHNEVSYTNYTGISVGFGWTASANPMTGNHINWNNIHHVEQLLADAGEIYTLSNQGSGDQIQYNYLHDISASQWADYWINGIYLDEQTSGYTVSNNVFSNAPSGVACNSCGSYTQSNNTGSAASTISGAGIESAYSDIKNNLTVPLPVFASTTGILSGGSNAIATGRELSAQVHDGQLVVLAPRDAVGESSTGTLSVFDLQGKCVARISTKDASSGVYSVDLSSEPVGRYFAILQSDKARYSASFVKL